MCWPRCAAFLPNPAARLTLRHPEMLVAHLGNYGELVLRVLADAAAENPTFTLNVQ